MADLSLTIRHINGAGAEKYTASASKKNARHTVNKQPCTRTRAAPMQLSQTEIASGHHTYQLPALAMCYPHQQELCHSQFYNIEALKQHSAAGLGQVCHATAKPTN